jgi:hypothetical protein
LFQAGVASHQGAQAITLGRTQLGVVYVYVAIVIAGNVTGTAFALHIEGTFITVFDEWLEQVTAQLASGQEFLNVATFGGTADLGQTFVLRGDVDGEPSKLCGVIGCGNQSAKSSTPIDALLLVVDIVSGDDCVADAFLVFTAGEGVFALGTDPFDTRIGRLFAACGLGEEDSGEDGHNGVTGG